jgi:uncharacterized membrane protein YeaQ/YmgE (transglycosylase-associated protein family)
MPGNEPGEIIFTVLLGIAGAFVAGFVATCLGLSDGVNNFDLGTIVLGVVGALALLIVYRSILEQGFEADVVPEPWNVGDNPGYQYGAP